MISKLGVLFMRAIAPLPLRWIRAMGHALGVFLFWTIRSRRKVVNVNLRLCFPQWDEDQRRRTAREVFIHVAQSFLDRAWLWHADPEVVRRRLVLTGAVHEMAGREATILFCPYFVGLAAGVKAVSEQLSRRFVGIYTEPSNPVGGPWVLQGR